MTRGIPVLLLTADTGGGHRAAAEAVAEALQVADWRLVSRAGLSACARGS